MKKVKKTKTYIQLQNPLGNFFNKVWGQIDMRQTVINKKQEPIYII